MVISNLRNLAPDLKLKFELFSKDVELYLLHVGIFISFLSCLVYCGEGEAIIVWHPVYYIIIINIPGVQKSKP